jgi:hypothetical protein
VKASLPAPYGAGENRKGLARRPQWDQHGCHSTGMSYEQAWREHYRNVLVRRAHSRINQATLEKEVEDWEEALSEGQFACSLWRR